MSSLTFTKTPGTSERTIFIDVDEVTDGSGTDVYAMKTWLYADTAFTDWVDDLSSPSETEKTYRDEYSDYTLRIYCNITNIGGTDNSNTR